MDRKEELIAAARSVAARLGVRRLSIAEFMRETGITAALVYRHFDSWPSLCAVAGIAAKGSAKTDCSDTIFADMRDAFLAAGGICSQRKFFNRVPYGSKYLRARYGNWRGALAAFRRWAAIHEPAFPHMDALDMALDPLAASGRRTPGAACVPAWPSRGGRPCGQLIGFRAMVFAPITEAGVIALFGMVAAELGYRIETVAPGFPDCTARRHVGAGRWESVRVEFEYRSRSFREHGHDAAACDVIVCWRHDWAGCPLEVLELSSALAALR